jgi:hypothetical protein
MRRMRPCYRIEVDGQEENVYPETTPTLLYNRPVRWLWLKWSGEWFEGGKTYASRKEALAALRKRHPEARRRDNDPPLPQ